MEFTYDLDTIQNELRNSDNYWYSFLEKPNFELGVMVIGPGEEDIQTPHSSDEVYFVVAGDGFVLIDEFEYGIHPPVAFFVPSGIPHKFYGNTIPIVAYYALN